MSKKDLALYTTVDEEPRIASKQDGIRLEL
jgi:hypothetical protein